MWAEAHPEEVAQAPSRAEGAGHLALSVSCVARVTGRLTGPSPLKGLVAGLGHPPTSPGKVQLVRVRAQAAVDVVLDAVMLLTRGAGRVHVDGGIGEIPQAVQELVSRLGGHGMPFGDGEPRVHG